MGAEPTEPHLDRGQLQNRVVRGVLWTALHTLVSLPLAFGVNILLARVLGVVDYGRLAYLSTVIGIVSGLAGLSVSTALVQFGAKAHAAGRHDEVRRYLSGAQGFRLLVSGPITALVVLALIDVEPWLLTLALVFGVLAPSLLGSANECLTIENRSDRSAQLAMVRNFLLQVVVIVAVLTIGTPDAVWSARIIATGLMLTLPVWLIARKYRRAVLRPRPPWTLPRAFWAFALPTAVAGIIGSLAVDRTQIILLQWFSSPVAMGIFGLAFGLAGHIYAPAQSFIGPLTPAVSGLTEVDEPALRRAFLRATRAASAVGGSFAATALPALACLVPALYGKDFSAAEGPLLVLGLAGAVSLISSPHHAFLMARLQGRRLLLINLVSLVVNVVLALIFIPPLGAWGATISCAGGMVTRSLQLTLGESKVLEIGPRALLRSTGSVVVASTLAVGAWLVTRPLAPVPAAVAAILVGGTLYLVSIKVTKTGMTRQDVEAIARVFPARIRSTARFALSLLQGASVEEGRNT